MVQPLHFSRGMARILVIDDELEIRNLVASMLEIQQHNIVHAADGAQGLDLLHREKFDMVITDIYMPNVSGLDVIRWVLDESPNIPIIAMSGAGLGADLAQKTGATVVIEKPFQVLSFMSTVQYLLEER